MATKLVRDKLSETNVCSSLFKAHKIDKTLSGIGLGGKFGPEGFKSNIAELEPCFKLATKTEKNQQD